MSHEPSDILYPVYEPSDLLLTFPSPSNVQRNWCIQDSRCHMRRRTFFLPVNDVVCTWVCMGRDGPKCSECLPAQTCHFEPQEHVPRTSARTQTCVWDPGGLPVCHGAESTRKDPRPEEKKMPTCAKNTFVYMYKVPLRDVGDVISRG